MIGPSRRQSPTYREDPAAAFTLHERIARTDATNRRMWTAAGVALAASVVAYLLGLTLALHLGVALAAAAVGALVPVRGAHERALRWIETHSGYAYTTALELRTRRPNDPYAFAEAVDARARTATRDLTPAPPTAWWLPLFALAFGLAFLPALGGTGSPTSPMAPPPPAASAPPAPPTGPDAQETQDAAADEADISEDDRAEPELAEATDAPDAPTPDDEPVDTTDEATEGERPTEEEALSRFLDEQRAAEEREGTEADEAEGDRDDGAEDGGGERPAEAQREQDTGDIPENLELSPDDRAPDADAERVERLDEAAGDADGEGEEGEDDASGGTTEGQDDGTDEPQDGLDDAADDTGASPEDPDGDEIPGGEEAPDGEPGVDPDGETAGGQRGPEGQQPDEFLPEDGDEGGAGGDFGAAAEGEPEELPEVDARAPEFLPGELGDGPVTSGGEILLPGADPEALPEGAAPQEFQRAAERAISEGRIPVEFQEILRNYFR